MPLSIFVDALPYTECKENYANWFDNIQISELQPNVAYSSVLHWQLYCDKYPDDRNKFVDWMKIPEPNKKIRVVAFLFRFTDNIKPLSIIVRKIFDRLIFRKNVLANIPFRFRCQFSEQSEYLFWDNNTYSKEKMFSGYDVVSQDEGHLSLKDTIDKFTIQLSNNNKNMFLVVGEVDRQGHACARGDEYSKRIGKVMDQIKDVIYKYLAKYPNEEVLIVSDHGMSTINHYVKLDIEQLFGKQAPDTYIAYFDSCIMCIWSENSDMIKSMRKYFSKLDIGHLMSDEERAHYRCTNEMFGNLIFILKEGYCFKDSWFGISLRKHPYGEGMHGFWPQVEASDQMGTIMLINSDKTINSFYTYPQAYELISKVMHEGK